MWRKWFDGPSESLGGRTPHQAAATEDGRRKIFEMYQWYEEMDGHSLIPASMSGRVPKAYAFWKLGMGPGSAEEFAAEERIYNGGASARPSTQRSEKHERRLQKKMVSLWIPNRCELQGCEASQPNDLKRCMRCKCVLYCSKEHQAQDWARHKIECRALANYDIKPKTFQTAQDLEQHPIGCYPFSGVSKEKCLVCLASAPEVHLNYTPCCNVPMCDTDHEYEMFSNDKGHCLRSHKRYTSCHRHYEEKHPGNDWRECEICNQCEGYDDNNKNTRSFHSTNHFNTLPPLEKWLPRGSFLTFPCVECSKRVLPGHSSNPGHDDYTTKSLPKEHCGNIIRRRFTCPSCLEKEGEGA